MDKENLITNVMRKVPSKEEYGDSFYMDLRISAFPVMENLDMFDDSIREQIQDGMTNESIQSMYQIIGNGLDEIFLADRAHGGSLLIGGRSLTWPRGDRPAASN